MEKLTSIATMLYMYLYIYVMFRVNMMTNKDFWKEYYTNIWQEFKEALKVTKIHTK